jgi:predicted aspartyl protease
MRALSACMVSCLLTGIAVAEPHTTVVPIRLSDPTHFLLVPVEVNGVATTFFLDTGTAESRVSADFAEHIGLRNGERKLRSFLVGSIDATKKIGSLRVADPTQCCTRYDVRVTGSLGAAMWSTLDYVLDAQKPKLEVMPELRLAGTPGASPLRVAEERIYLPVTVEGRTFEFLLDTGRGGSQVIQSFIDRLREVNSDYVEVEVTTGDVKQYKKYPALHAEVRLGDVHIPQFTFFVGEENAIGVNLLQQGELSVSARDGLFTFRGHE